LFVECEYGHQWKVSPTQLITKDTWCPRCAHINGGIIHRKPLVHIYKLANDNNSILLNVEYTKQRCILYFKCENNHTWKIRTDHLKKRKHWCLECNKEKDLD